MSVPLYPKKLQSPVSITPRQHLEAELGDLREFEAPKAVVICFESYLMDHYRALNSTTAQSIWTGEMIFLEESGQKVALVGNFGIGGPAAAHMLEALIAMGVSRFIVVGHAGGLQTRHSIGSILLIEKSVRDEGLSYHYAEVARFAYPSKKLTKQLRNTLERSDQKYKIGSSWTIDSMYRETQEEIAHYQNEGIDAVEMELASLFTVASFRKVDLAAMLVISDYIGGNEWEHQLKSRDTSKALISTVEVAIKTFNDLA